MDKMLKITNLQEALKFAGFIEEALMYMTIWTPTIINNGGCGYSARLIHNKLAEIGVDTEIYAVYLRPGDAIGERALMRRWLSGDKTKTPTPEHVILKMGDLWIDSSGIVNEMGIKEVERHLLTPSQLDEIIEGANWNTTFDRTCLPRMEELLDEALSKFDIFTTGIFDIPTKGVKFTEHTIREDRKQKNLLFGLLGGTT